MQLQKGKELQKDSYALLANLYQKKVADKR
jgi:hypothetical protein